MRSAVAFSAVHSVETKEAFSGVVEVIYISAAAERRGEREVEREKRGSCRDLDKRANASAAQACFGTLRANAMQVRATKRAGIGLSGSQEVAEERRERETQIASRRKCRAWRGFPPQPRPDDHQTTPWAP